MLRFTFFSNYLLSNRQLEARAAEPEQLVYHDDDDDGTRGDLPVPPRHGEIIEWLDAVEPVAPDEEAEPPAAEASWGTVSDIVPGRYLSGAKGGFQTSYLRDQPVK
jgi:hypothetical protein